MVIAPVKQSVVHYMTQSSEQESPETGICQSYEIKWL